MQMMPKIRRALRSMLLGDTDLPQSCSLSLRDPQTEIVVWLQGMGAPRDVTMRHSVACTAPFLVCIGFEGETGLQEKASGQLSLRFSERGGDARLLGEIGLRLLTVLSTAGPALCLFEARSCTSFCLPQPRLWAHYAHHAYRRWKIRNVTDVRMSNRGARCNSVMFICPRPVVLVSLLDGAGGNIFPMNLMGSIGEGYFAFALNSKRRAAPLVERVGQLALSSIPFRHSTTAQELGKHHYLESMDWEQLPFKTRSSAVLGIPVPEFALRVRELKIRDVRRLGSHTLFVARIVGDEYLADGPAYYMIHGLYEAWRRRSGRPAQPLVATAEQTVLPARQ